VGAPSRAERGAHGATPLQFRQIRILPILGEDCRSSRAHGKVKGLGGLCLCEQSLAVAARANTPTLSRIFSQLLEKLSNRSRFDKCMNSLRTLLGLEADERRLVFRTLVLVAAIRVAFWVLPFQRLQRVASSWSSWKYLPINVPPDMPVSRLVWAVRAASRRVPAASCLTQSLALQCLLTRAGHRSRIRIGAAKDVESGFQAHAWVEYLGEPLLSGPDELARYVRMFAVEDKLA